MIRQPYISFCFSLYSTVMVRVACFLNSVADDLVGSATGGSICLLLFFVKHFFCFFLKIFC